MAKPVRMADIAKQLGVSTVTVSKALAGKDGVGESLRAEIISTADKMGYMKRSESQMPAGSQNIAILIPERYLLHQGSFYWTLYQNIATQLTAHHFFNILEILTATDEENKTIPKVLSQEDIGALICVAQISTDYYLFLEKHLKIPVIYLDFYNPYCTSNAIISDSYHGMYTVTNYLIHLGHRDIYFVGTVNATSSIRERYYGYRAAMTENGLKVTDEMVIPDRDPDDLSKISPPSSLVPKHIPTAFVCNSDDTASSLITELKEHGLRVPEDVSVVGYDNFVPGEDFVPRITTYSANMQALAQVCVKQLIKRLTNANYVSQLQVVSGRLLIKDSAAPPPKRD